MVISSAVNRSQGDCVDRRLAAAVFAIGTFAPTWPFARRVCKGRKLLNLQALYHCLIKDGPE